MLLYWGFTWEADENEFFVGKRELLTAGNTPKPIQTGFEMLAQLLPKRVNVVKDKKGGRLGLMATKSTNKIALLLYNYQESDGENPEGSDNVYIKLTGLKKNLRYTVESIALNDKNNNTYQTWRSMGSPENADGIDLSPLKTAGVLRVTHQFEIKANEKGEGKIDMVVDRSAATLMILKTND